MKKLVKYGCTDRLKCKLLLMVGRSVGQSSILIDYILLRFILSHFENVYQPCRDSGQSLAPLPLPSLGGYNYLDFSCSNRILLLSYVSYSTHYILIPLREKNPRTSVQQNNVSAFVLVLEGRKPAARLDISGTPGVEQLRPMEREVGKIT